MDEPTAPTEVDRFRRLAELATDVLVETGPGGTIQWVSPSLRDVLGWEVADWVGTRVSDHVHPDDVAGARARATQPPGPGAGQVWAHARFRTAEGGWRWMSATGRAVRDESGATVGGLDALRDVDDEVRSRQELEAERALLRSVLDVMIDPLVLLDPVRDADGRVVDFMYADLNPAAEQYLALPRAEIRRRRVSEVMPPESALRYLPDFVRVFETGEPLVSDVAVDEPTAYDGGRRAFDVRAVKVGQQLSCTWRDVTDRMTAAHELAESEARFRLLAENSSDIIFRGTPDSRVAWVSPAVQEVLGFTPDEMLGRQTIDLVAEGARATVQELLASSKGPGVRTYEAPFLTARGDSRWLSVSVRPLMAGGTIAGWVGSARDVDSEHHQRQWVDYLAAHDELTSALNRRAVLNRLEAWLTRPRSTDGLPAVLYVDLDGLKPINDSLGHATGDEVLMEVVRRVSDSIRGEDVVGRLGGDEFAVLLSRVDGAAGARAVAEKIRAAVAEPVVAEGHRVTTTASIGIALAREDDTTDAVLHRADAALYRAKELGGNRTVVDGDAATD